MSEKQSSHCTAIVSQWKLAQRARKRTRITGGKLEIYDASPAPDLGMLLVAAKQAEDEAYAQMMAQAQPGDKIEGRGIFIGTWQPQGLGETFNFFAAPEDLPGGTRNYVDTVDAVAALENWHGHSGGNFANAAELYDAINNGTYNGSWFIPPKELLYGKTGNDDEVEYRIIQRDNLLAHQGKGALKDTFKTSTTAKGATVPAFYWSSTENPDLPGQFWFSRTDANYTGNCTPDKLLYCRPVRLEPRL